MGANSGHHYCTSAGQGVGPPPDDLGRKISRPTVTGRNRIGPANAAAAATLGRRIFVFSGHFRPIHTSFPPFLNPLNSFSWSFSPDSSPFERYDKNKNSADYWIEFFGHHNDCWTKVMVLMSSWPLRLSIDMWFVNFGRRLISFPFLGCFG